MLAFATQERRVLLTSNARDFAPLAAQWFLNAKEHWGIVIVPGQTNKSSLVEAFQAIYSHETADSIKNTFRYMQEWL